MNEQFSFDVFFSYSSKDKTIVHSLVERLRQHGLRVWLDVLQIRPGDSIPVRIEDGLENSRVLVLCMSANAFASDWSVLESQTFCFRDPLNKERRFIPLRLDDAPPKGSLAQFAYIDWRPEAQDSQFEQLLAACRHAEEEPAEDSEGAGQLLEEKIVPLRHKEDDKSLEDVNSIAFSPDGKLALSGSDDGTVWLWDVDSGRELRELKGHTRGVLSVAFSLNGKLALSSSDDKTVRLWEVASGRQLRELKGHTQAVNSVAFRDCVRTNL